MPDSDEEDEILAEIRKKQDELRYVVSFFCCHDQYKNSLLFFDVHGIKGYK